MKYLSLLALLIIGLSANAQFYSKKWLPPWQNPLLQSRDSFLKSKDEVRFEIMKRSQEVWDKSAPAGNDDVSKFLEAQPTYRTLIEMEKNGLLSGKTATQPWSDDYWPIYSGIIGKRYSDPYFAYKDSWVDFYDYVRSQPAKAIWAGEDEEAKKSLGPSEKYDHLIGDDKGTLTKQLWLEGKAYWDRYHEVESWMGICHGWSPASFSLDRPKKAITLKSPKGDDILFYPSDIKALGSLLWANSSPRTIFIGGRCNTRNPDEDENGRIIDPECFDTNPSTWHMAMVEMVGIRKESFVFDATYDYQVWNQPVASYQYTYFNPQSMDEGIALDEAKVKLSNFSDDRYKKYRSPKAKYVVGVEMEVEYLVETEPTARLSDDENWDSLTSAYYMYDLEIDDKGRIVGGEWYQSYHPDFMWRPRPGEEANTFYDYGLRPSDWKEGAALPSLWRQRAQRASQGKLPLGVIVREMIEKTKR